MAEHSVLPPSSAARRVACPGSRELESLHPQDEESSYAREGEAAHWVAAEYLRTGLEGNEYFEIYPMTALNGEPITLEMQEGAEIYTDFIKSILLKLNVPLMSFDTVLHIEETVSITNIHPECWGTPDCWFLAGNNLHIFDYKYGHGFVEVFENWQLLEYSAGIINNFESNVSPLDIHFHIIQPRNYHKDGPIRSWSIKEAQLERYFDILRSAEAQAMSPNAPCLPSPECGYCLGRRACQALQQTALTAVDLSIINTPWNLNPNQLGAELRYLRHAAELLDARITGLSEEALSLLKKGKRVPFFKISDLPSRERWKVPPEQVVTMGEMLGVDLRKPVEVVTPKQAMKAGISEDVVRAFLEPVKSSLKLTSDDGDAARKIFWK